MNSLNVILISLWLIISTAGAFFLGQQLTFEKQKTKQVFIPPPKELKYFTFGYSQAFADSLWLRWVQDVEACGKAKVNRSDLTPFVLTEKNSSYTAFKEVNEKNPACPLGWSFKMLDVITELDPKFALAYTLGAPTLSILAHDPLGAEAIYEKGLKEFPEDWALAYRAGYHAQFELYQPEKAANRFNKSANLGAPNWLKSLAARLMNESGQLDLAIAILEDYKQGLVDEIAIQKVDERLADLRSRLNVRK